MGRLGMCDSLLEVVGCRSVYVVVFMKNRMCGLVG